MARFHSYQTADPDELPVRSGDHSRDRHGLSSGTIHPGNLSLTHGRLRSSRRSQTCPIGANPQEMPVIGMPGRRVLPILFQERSEEGARLNSRLSARRTVSPKPESWGQATEPVIPGDPSGPLRHPGPPIPALALRKWSPATETGYFSAVPNSDRAYDSRYPHPVQRNTAIGTHSSRGGSLVPVKLQKERCGAPGTQVSGAMAPPPISVTNPNCMECAHLGQVSGVWVMD